MLQIRESMFWDLPNLTVSDSDTYLNSFNLSVSVDCSLCQLMQ